jgi:hypothetical protein
VALAYADAEEAAGAVLTTFPVVRSETTLASIFTDVRPARSKAALKIDVFLTTISL